MTRTLSAVLLACACAIAMPTALAREVRHLSAADAGNCPAEVAAAKAEAEDQADARASAKPAQSTARARPSVRGPEAHPAGTRLQAPRWHSFLPGMFR